LLPVFASTVIPDFSLLQIQEKGVCSLLDMYKFISGGFLFDEGGVDISV
jgi:hypothetical protein